MIKLEKYLSPIHEILMWKTNSIFIRHGRVDLCGRMYYAFQQRDTKCWNLTIRQNDRYFKTLQKALDALDEFLLNNGYIFLSQEQFDRLKVLL